ncbi:hypothetical protein AB7813_08920 [Tardiphaga sp. 20_F10_N6_6]|uniref:hypothetical protein n=1 Tax=Tardiphaga sp. 20_F10_N6_6 TaxID=3240788 RepID=UPI003F8BFB93
MQTVDQSTNPPQVLRLPDGESRKRTAPSALDVIRRDYHKISPPDPKFEQMLLDMQNANDLTGMLALYEALTAAAETLLGVFNKPRTDGIAAGYVETVIYDDLWARAYAVAFAMKDMQADDFSREWFAETLFSCALRMDAGLDAAVAVVAHVNGGTR